MTESVTGAARPGMLGAVLSAMEFYTRVPRPPNVPWCAEDARHAGAFAPLAGVLVGVFGAAVWWLATIALPPALAALLAIAAVIWFTGALHEDGLADVCDAFGARVDAARTLDILKEPQLGVYGVLALLLVLALRIVALAQVGELAGGAFAVVLAAFVAAHAVSRFAAVYLTRSLDYVRADDARSKVGAFAAPLHGQWLSIAATTSAVALLPLVLLGLGAALWALPLIVLFTIALRSLYLRRIGGYTGDCLGCVQQVAETVLWLAVVGALFNGSAT